MTTTVRIDIDKLTAAIDAATGLAERINTQRSTAISAAPIELPSLGDGQLGKVSLWLTDNLPELEARRDLAILLDTDGNGSATYEVYTDNLDSVRRLLGQELAAAGSQIHPGFPEEFNAFSDMLSRWVDDPTVMNSMYLDLGADGTLQLLSSAAIDTRDSDTFASQEEQQRLLDLVRSGLETATTYPAFPEQTFARQLVEEAARDPEDIMRDTDHIGYNPSGALAFLLTDGQFGDDFLTTVAEELDDYERVQMDGAPNLWGYRPDNGANFGNFVDWAYTYDNLDPMTGLMSALENSPQVALDFFSDNDDPDQPREGINSRAYYYLHERTWEQDGFDAVSGAVDAATTNADIIADPESQNAQNAALLVSKYVDYMSTRENFDDIVERAGALNSGVAEHTSHMLTTYMAAVDNALMPSADGDVDPGVGRLVSDALGGEYPNMPLFDRESLERLSLLGMATDDGFAQMRDGLNDYRGQQLGTIADRLAADPDSASLQASLELALGADARMEGFFVDVIQSDKIRDADAQDARTEAWIEFGNEVIDVIPVPGVDNITSEVAKNIINGAVDRGQSSGTDAITEWLANNGDTARASANDAADATLQQHSYIVASLLADRGLSAGEIDLPTWEEYSEMSDADQRYIRSQLYSTEQGVGTYFNIDNYYQAYDAEFREYFENGGEG